MDFVTILLIVGAVAAVGAIVKTVTGRKDLNLDGPPAFGLAADSAGPVVPGGAVLARYQGGHPELPRPGAVHVWREGDRIALFYEGTGGELNRTVEIPIASIVGLTLDSNVQHVTTGGGSSLGRAVVGGLVAGGVGAIVASRKGVEVKTIDESRVYLVVRHGVLQTQVVFLGGAALYGRLAPLFAGASIAATA